MADDNFTDKAAFPAGLSILLPGLGQFYNKDNGKGLVMLVFALFVLYLIWFKDIGTGSLLSVPLWIWSVIDAYKNAKSK